MFTATASANGLASSEANIQSHAILAAARKAAHGLQYARNVTPEQAWTLFSSGIAELVDVRTDKKLLRVGHVPDAGHVEWLTGAELSKNPRFTSKLGSLVGKGNVVLFLCRSGKRSTAAAEAATEAGFRNAFNVLKGFEGDGNPKFGWLNHGLPAVEN